MGRDSVRANQKYVDEAQVVRQIAEEIDLDYMLDRKCWRV